MCTLTLDRAWAVISGVHSTQSASMAACSCRQLGQLWATAPSAHACDTSAQRRGPSCEMSRQTTEGSCASAASGAALTDLRGWPPTCRIFSTLMRCAVDSAATVITHEGTLYMCGVPGCELLSIIRPHAARLRRMSPWYAAQASTVCSRAPCIWRPQPGHHSADAAPAEACTNCKGLHAARRRLRCEALVCPTQVCRRCERMYYIAIAGAHIGSSKGVSSSPVSFGAKLGTAVPVGLYQI